MPRQPRRSVTGVSTINSRPEQPEAIGGEPARSQSAAQNGVMVLCTYCGSLSISTSKCSNCGGYFDLLSRQRTQNAMGPWFIRDQVNPFHPGCSYDTLRRLVARGRVRPDTVMRGPTTRQFWSFARNTPGVAHLLGACHACHTPVDAHAQACPSCNASFIVANDRQQLGLAPMQMLPGDADPAAVADAAFGPAVPASSTAERSERSASHAEPRAETSTESAAAIRPTAGVASRPVRRRSAGPMVAVAASVGCAIIALVAVVYLNRADGTAAAAASETPPGQMPSESTSRIQPPGAATLAPDVSATDPQAETMPVLGGEPTRVEDVAAREALAAPDADEPRSGDDRATSEAGAPADRQEAESPAAQPRSSVLSQREAVGIGTMTVQDLAEAREAWVSTGRDDLVQAADRRVQQLELRAMFGI